MAYVCSLLCHAGDRAGRTQLAQQSKFIAHGAALQSNQHAPHVGKAEQRPIGDTADLDRKVGRLQTRLTPICFSLHSLHGLHSLHLACVSCNPCNEYESRFAIRKLGCEKIGRLPRESGHRGLVVVTTCFAPITSDDATMAKSSWPSGHRGHLLFPPERACQLHFALENPVFLTISRCSALRIGCCVQASPQPTN
jgi:hypothetical protein